MTTTTTRLICPECQRENESERIYCHNCGARLDRAALTQRGAPVEDPKKAHRRVQKMFDPHRGNVRRNFFFVSKLVLGALAVAAVVEMVSAPEVPPARKGVGIPVEINFDLEKATSSRAPMQLQYTQDQVNAYLEYTLKNKRSLDKPYLKFNRAIVGFAEGLCTVTVERSFFGYSLYTRTSCQVALANGKIGASSKAGAIGRLPIHPRLMQYIDVIFADVWAALDRERKLMAKMGSIEFHDANVTLTSAAPSS